MDGYYIPRKINLSFKYKIHKSTDDYKILTQYNEKTDKYLKLISFKDFLICDWDTAVDDFYNNIVPLLRTSGCTWYIYKTYNGFHGYCLSKTFDNTSFATHQFMYKLRCDHWYISFTKLNGFVVRLEPKADREETFVEQFLMQINDNNCPIMGHLKQLLEFKDSLLSNTQTRI